MHGADGDLSRQINEENEIFNSRQINEENEIFNSWENYREDHGGGEGLLLNRILNICIFLIYFIIYIF